MGSTFFPPPKDKLVHCTSLTTHTNNHSSQCCLLWEHILKHQFEQHCFTFCNLGSGILTLLFLSSWSEAYPTSSFLEGHYNTKYHLFRQKTIFLVMSFTSESVLRTLSFSSAQWFTQFISKTEPSQIHFSKTVSVKDCSISDGAIQTFPSWASRVEVHAKYSGLCKFPVWLSFISRENNFYSLSNS